MFLHSDEVAQFTDTASASLPFSRLIFERFGEQPVEPATGHLATLVGEIITVPAAEILRSGGLVEVGYPPATEGAASIQGTGEPVSHATEIAGCRLQRYRVADLLFLTLPVSWSQCVDQLNAREVLQDSVAD